MNQKPSSTFNQKKADQFAEKMLQHFNGAAIGIMTSIGHRTGLWDTMSDLPPSTSEEIAKKANLNERYVREALGTFVTGGIVEYDPKNKTYHLPTEHAGFLTRKAIPNNLAVTAQFISILGGVEDAIVGCFKKGGGVDYEQFNRFHEVMSEESNQTVVFPLIDTLIPLVPGLKEKLEQGIEVLDIGCGSGYALSHLAKHFPNSHFVGYDLCQEAIDRANSRAKELGLNNITFETKDVTQVHDTNRYDLITSFDAIHDQAHPDKVLKNIHTALKDDGVYFMQDIAGSSYVEKNKEHPIGPFIYTISCMHCMTVSLAQNGAGLGAMWGKEKACEMLNEAGFDRVDVKELEHDFINYYYIVRK